MSAALRGHALYPYIEAGLCVCRLASGSNEDDEEQGELFTIRNYKGTRQVVRRSRAHSVP